MPKFLWKAAYTTAGAKGVANQGGRARRDALKRAIESVGGNLEAFYFAFGSDDVYLIADMPDNEAAVAVAVAINSTDGASVETVVLLTPEQVDTAVRRKVTFTPATM
jgi:uncharacterized protein with GYD domain